MTRSVILAVLAALAPWAFPVTAAVQTPSAGRPVLTLLSKAGTRTLSIVVRDRLEMVPLDELAEALQLAVREDALAGGVTVSYRNETIVLTPDQPLASVRGRLVALSGAPVRDGRRLLVPLEFIPRALAPAYEARLDLRVASRLLIVGDVRVPRVGIRGDQTDAGARVTLEIAPRTPHAISQTAGQLVVRFEADALDLTVPSFAVPRLVTGLRAIDPTALAIDLGPRFRQFRTTQSGDANLVRVAIDVVGEETVPPPVREPPAELPPPLPGPQPALQTIVLDPGHGGGEDGARGPGGALEKDIALSVARRLKATLETELGVRVILTRDGDETVPLDARAAIANNNKADLFISLHANASPRREARGAEVFYLSLDGYGEEARRAAETAGHVLPVIGGGTREIEVILWEMAQVRYLEESARLATFIEDELRNRIEMSPRAVQQAPFRVLVGANMPAVLVEMGFVSNQEEEQRLTTAAHQSLIVQALYNGILKFRDYLEQRRSAGSAGRR